MKASITAFYNNEDDFDSKWNYNNQDFFLRNIWRLRWVLVDFQDSKYYGCVDLSTLEIKSDAKWKELYNAKESDLQNYVEENDIEWLGDDFDHMQNYLCFLNNHIPNFRWFSTEHGYKYPEYLEIKAWIKEPIIDRVHVPLSEGDIQSFERYVLNGEKMTWSFETEKGNTIEITFEQERDDE